jgi:hypothetical protein
MEASVRLPAARCYRCRKTIRVFPSQPRICSGCIEFRRRVLDLEPPSTECECSAAKTLDAEACETCLDKDGRSPEERDIISALRVMGGHAQATAIIEDMGYEPDRDYSGAGYRRMYRGMAKLRERGMITSHGEIDEGLTLANCRGAYATEFVPTPQDNEQEELLGPHQAKRARTGYYRVTKRKTKIVTSGAATKDYSGGVVTYSLRGGR